MLTADQLRDIANFIDNSLDREWDQHTNNFICYERNIEAGKRRMNPEMYDMIQTIQDAAAELDEFVEIEIEIERSMAEMEAKQTE